MQDGDVIFEEEQRFRQPWIWLILACITLMAVAAAWQQLVLGRPFGERPMPDAGVWATLAFAAAFDLFFWVMRLETVVRRSGLTVRFFPLHLSPHRIPLENAVSWEARRYRPIRDYGGWGIRYGRGGKAYTVSGHQGVRIEYADGSHLLIGSQHPGQLEAALDSVARP